MCGIIGYVGKRQAAPLLLEGLGHLEYRGYDSAGIAVLAPEGELAIRKAPGKLSNLIATMEGVLPAGSTGLGHTRWATHGVPNEANAHPHTDCAGQVVIVHNGIVENYADLRALLRRQGHAFTSQTDSEVIAHLVEEELQRGQDFPTAFRLAVRQLRGAHAIAALQCAEPHTLVGVRIGNAGGISVGYGRGEMFLASDLPALLPLTDRVVFLAPGETVTLSPRGATFAQLDGRSLAKEPTLIPYNPVAAAKGGYKHFMQKEIHEQPESVTNAIRGRVFFDPENVFLEEVPFTAKEVQDFRRVILVGMGTSLHAGMVGQHMVEELSGIPATAENSSEFRYRDPVLDAQTLVVSIGQSGETVDTLAAMEGARDKGARLLTLCNVEDSQATRLAEGVVHLRAGLEIGVAATKTFLNTLSVLYLLGVHLGVQRNYFRGAALRQTVRDLARLPEAVGRVLEPVEAYIQVAHEYFTRSNFLYIGRGVHYPVALEGALKLKEISYIHAEGTAAGEMKHGPIALVDSSLPVVALCLRNHLYAKMLANVAEVKTRSGIVIALATQGDREVAKKADHVLYVPEAPNLLSSLVAAVPLQLLAYHIAVLRGCDVDQPRNLAKSVTVE